MIEISEMGTSNYLKIWASGGNKAHFNSCGIVYGEDSKDTYVLRQIGCIHFFGNGDIVISPIGGMKANTPPSMYKPGWSRTIVLNFLEEYKGIKHDAATASTKASIDSNFDIICDVRVGFGQIFVVTTKSLFSHCLCASAGSIAFTWRFNPRSISRLNSLSFERRITKSNATSGSISVQASRDPRLPPL